MTKLTSFEFVHAIVSHETMRRSYKIQVSKIFHFTDELMEHNVTCYLGESSFMDLEEKYPDDVIVSRQSVELRNLPQLKERLDVQLRYFLDDKIDRMVWTAWQKAGKTSISKCPNKRRNGQIKKAHIR